MKLVDKKIARGDNIIDDNGVIIGVVYYSSIEDMTRFREWFAKVAIDLSDIPEVGEDWFKEAKLKHSITADGTDGEAD